MTNFSIIMINHKNYELSKQCLDGLFNLKNFDNNEVIVIDNGSNDGSVERFQKDFPEKIKMIANAKNIGFAKANNQGAKIAQGKWFVFLNNDTIIKDDFLSSAKQIFQSNNLIKVVSPRLLDSTGGVQEMAFNYFPNLWRVLSRRSKKEIKVPENTKTLEVDWVSGCALMIEREIFNKIGGWDENFFLYFEDVDLCKRVRNLGYKAVVDFQSEIIHIGGKGVESDTRRKQLCYQSQDYYFKKWRPKLELYILKVVRKLLK